MTRLGSRPSWWDVEVDRAGRAIRADVRAAAHEIWGRACSRAESVLGDRAEAPELMENSVAQVSRYLDRAGAPLGSQSTEGLLMVTFHRALQRYAGKVRRLETVGGTGELSGWLPDNEWATHIDARLDLEKIVRHLSERSCTVLALRDAGYEWKEIAQMLRISVPAAKNGLLRDLRRVKSQFLKETVNEEIGPTK
jgi:DNA-directed RNA polymerase specialized sigma24 family protein